MNILRWLLSNQHKSLQKQKENDGFTLIELLVAMILALLVLTPLLAFMVNILQTDRQEQAKANSEQEIQAALDYISRDLQQAVYVYDATGVDTIKSQLLAVTNGVPVLVFWKREFTKQGFQLKNISTQDDSFVYSLVVYYLIKDNNSTWSNAARIARFQISDGVPDLNSSTTCPNAYDTTQKFSVCPDQGFNQIQQKMNSWTKASQNYTQFPLVLIDFIDQTTTTDGAPATNCPTGFSTVPSSASTKITGFYACVNSLASDNKSVTQVYLRGNALVRLTNSEMKYNANKSTYFPQANIRVQGRSFLVTK